MADTHYKRRRSWLNLQSHYDLEQERERFGKQLEKEVKVLAAA